MSVSIEINWTELKERLPLLVQKMKEEAAIILLSRIIEVFENQGPLDAPWQELTELAIGKKGSRTILIDSGILKNSIRIGPNIEGEPIEVGIFEGPALTYAMTHEYGAVIEVTQKMRDFFLAKTLEERKHKPNLPEENYIWHPLRSDTEVIEIPARPFIRSGFERAEKDIEEMMQRYWQVFITTGMVSK